MEDNMVKKLTALVVSFVTVFGFAMPASALQAGDSQALTTAWSTQIDVEVTYDGERICQPTGTTWVYDVDDQVGYYDADDERVELLSVSEGGVIACEVVPDGENLLSITALRAGEAEVTWAEVWTEYDYRWDYEAEESIETPVTQSETHSFTVKVVTLENKSGTVEKTVLKPSYGEAFALFTFKIDGVSEDAPVDKASGTAEDDDYYIQEVGEGEVTLGVYGARTHNIKLEIYDKIVPLKLVLRVFELKSTGVAKNTGGVVAYPGSKTTLATKLTGVKNPKVNWVSSNSKVVKVSSKGVVKAKKKGRCTVKAKCGGATIEVPVEVTSKGAYQAVKNGFKDMKTKLTYSQPNRMASKCRDCSSFVSRCYWDNALGRRITLIGDSIASQWAYNAAMQASWLNSHNKRVSWKACSVKKLRPGDTIYFETHYAGKDASQWRYIDHAALYVGNGYYLNTGGYGGKGTVGLASYYEKDKRIKFIGRPIS